MAFSFLECFLFILETFAFLYYANEESDDIINSSTDTESRISPEILKQCSSNLAPEMYITEETE